MTFIVSVEAGLFAEGSELRASLWSGDQLEILEKNSRCSVSYDPATATEELLCPEGIVYQEVVPEEVTARIEGSAVHLELASERVGVGEEFRLVVAGRSADGCNTTSAQTTGTADSPTMVLDGLVWETTMRACATG